MGVQFATKIHTRTFIASLQSQRICLIQTPWLALKQLPYTGRLVKQIRCWSHMMSQRLQHSRDQSFVSAVAYVPYSALLIYKAGADILLLLFLDFQTAIISGLLFEIKACLEKLKVLPSLLKNIFFFVVHCILYSTAPSHTPNSQV